MEPEDIPFGIRRYPLAMVFFVGGGLGMIAWGQSVDAPMFVFPFGRLDATNASLVLSVIGVVAVLLACVMSYMRFVKRPVVALREDSISIPVGEFAQTTVTLRAGDVLSVQEGDARAGGWRTCRVRHRGGELALHSSSLPSDEAFFKICERLRALAPQR